MAGACFPGVTSHQKKRGRYLFPPGQPTKTVAGRERLSETLSWYCEPYVVGEQKKSGLQEAGNRIPSSPTEERDPPRHPEDRRSHPISFQRKRRVIQSNETQRHSMPADFNLYYRKGKILFLPSNIAGERGMTSEKFALSPPTEETRGQRKIAAGPFLQLGGKKGSITNQFTQKKGKKVPISS